MWELAVVAPLGGRADHPAKWVLLKQDDRARRFIVRHGPLFQENKGEHQRQHHPWTLSFAFIADKADLRQSSRRFFC